MNLPLFVDQPFCKERSMCQECRDPASDLYRKAWALRYQMPPNWPECPFGVPVGYQAPPKAVPPSLVALAYDNPESPEAEEAAARVRLRASALLPICRHCPSHHYHSDNGTTVDCAVATACCTDRFERGLVHLGCGNCTQGHFAPKGAA